MCTRPTWLGPSCKWDRPPYRAIEVHRDVSVQPYSGWREKVYLTPGCLAVLLVSGSQALTHSSPMKLHLLCRSNKSFQCHISSINSVYQISLIFASFGKIQFKILSLCLSSLLWLLIHSFCTRQMFRLAQIFSSSSEFCLVLAGNRSNLPVPSREFKRRLRKL